MTYENIPPFLRRYAELFMRAFATSKIYVKFLGVKMGKNCAIFTKHFPTEPYLIEIGDDVAITEGVYLHTHGGARVAWKKYPKFDTFGKIIIKNGAYIGSGSHIMPGVTIGEGALVAAGSIVTKSVPDHTVVAGNPARVICTVDDYINKNLPFNTDTKNMSWDEKKKFLLSMPEEKFIKKYEMRERRQ